MTKEELRHLHRLLDAMLSNKDVWVPHWKLNWEPTKIVNITRAGTVTVRSGRNRGFHACPADVVHLEDPKMEEK